MFDDPSHNVLLDGGAPGTLGRPRRTCTSVTDYDVLDRPAQTLAAHRAFAEAGAHVILTCTQHTLPHLGEDWRVVASNAVTLARAGAGSAAVWGAIGQASTARQRWADAPVRVRNRLTAGWGDMAAECRRFGATGFALQSFHDPVECAAAIGAVRAAAPDVPVAASLYPRADGRLMDGADPADALHALRQAGASLVGFSCGGGPMAIEAAVARAPDADWARPSRGSVHRAAFVKALVRLAKACRYVGGCCGVDATLIADLHEQTRAARLAHPSEVA